MKNLLAKPNIKTPGALAKRAVALLLAAALTLSPVDLTAVRAKAIEGGNANAATNTLTIYEYKRANRWNDVPTDDSWHPVLIAWKSGGNDYVCNGGWTHEYDDDYDAITGKQIKSEWVPELAKDRASGFSFTTLELLSDWQIKYVGKDGDNQNAPMYTIGRTNGNNLNWGKDWDWNGNTNTPWTFYAGGYVYGEFSYSWKDVDGEWRIIHNKSGADPQFKRSGTTAYGDSSISYTYGDTFHLYVGYKKTISVISDDYTVTTGTVMNIDDGVLIEDGVTVTVMPGAVLSVEGQLYNNGTIKNYGTVVLQPSSCVSVFHPEDITGGKIICSGEAISEASNNDTVIALREAELVKANKELNVRQFGTQITDPQIPAVTTAATSADLKAVLTKLKQYTELSRNSEKYESKKSTTGAYVIPGMMHLEELVTEAQLAFNAQDTPERRAEIRQAQDPYEEQLAAYLEMEADPNTTEEQAELFYTEIVRPLEKAYKAAVLEYNIADEALTEAKSLRDENIAALTKAQAKVDRLTKKLEEIKSGAANNPTVLQGEGSLIVMDNARLVLQNNPQQLVVQRGGTLVCSGYIISPNAMTLADSTLQIRKGGHLIIGYDFTSRLVNYAKMTVQNRDTLNVTFSNFSETKDTLDASIYVSGTYRMKVDGVLRYRGSACIKDGSGNSVAISAGDSKGKWSTEGSTTSERLSDGAVRTTYLDPKMTRTEWPDGRVLDDFYSEKILTDPNTQRQVITYVNGTSVERSTVPGNKTYIKRDADGWYTEAEFYSDDGISLGRYKPELNAVVYWELDENNEPKHFHNDRYDTDSYYETWEYEDRTENVITERDYVIDEFRHMKVFSTMSSAMYVKYLQEISEGTGVRHTLNGDEPYTIGMYVTTYRGYKTEAEANKNKDKEFSELPLCGYSGTKTLTFPDRVEHWSYAQVGTYGTPEEYPEDWFNMWFLTSIEYTSGKYKGWKVYFGTQRAQNVKGSDGKYTLEWTEGNYHGIYNILLEGKRVDEFVAELWMIYSPERKYYYAVGNRAASSTTVFYHYGEALPTRSADVNWTNKLSTPEEYMNILIMAKGGIV